MGGVHTKKAIGPTRKQALARPTFTGKASPKYILPGTVYDAALDRIRWLFEEFDGDVSVSNSGGKDSTIVVELALIVARERGELPLKVVWLDQECEFASTVEYQRWMADRPEVDFHWYQIPFKLFNATNHDEPWLHVWGEGEEWVREKEEDSIHENTFFKWNGEQVDRFKEVLAEINKRTGGAILTGMRSEESPQRRVLMTTKPMYKWVTWGSEGFFGPTPDNPNKKSYLDPDTPGPLYWMFHPIYDWSYRDVWKAIYDNDWRYNKMYDVQFRYGVPINKMRVSNYHHETAIHSLFYLQEAEPETWEAATRRLQGISTMGHIGRADLVPTELPYMFTGWEEYLFHLIDNLCSVEESRQTFRKMYAGMLRSLPEYAEHPKGREKIIRSMVSAVCRNDLYGTTTSMTVTGMRHPLALAEWRRTIGTATKADVEAVEKAEATVNEDNDVEEVLA